MQSRRRKILASTRCLGLGLAILNTQIISGKVSLEKKADTQAAKEQQTAYCCDSDLIGRRGCNSDLIDRRGCNSDWIGRQGPQGCKLACNSDWIGRRGCYSDWIGRRGCNSTVDSASRLRWIGRRGCDSDWISRRGCDSYRKPRAASAPSSRPARSRVVRIAQIRGACLAIRKFSQN